MSNWAGNPMHQRQSLMNYALPHLLFNECHKYCVNNNDLKVAETASEKSCISNCQAKTYSAFNMYMRVQTQVEQKKTERSYIDISRYTNMEVEHQHDTASEIDKSMVPHVNPIHTKNFTRNVDEQLGQLKSEALE